MNLIIRTVIVAVLMGVILTAVQSYSDDARYEVLLDDYEALQEAYNDLYEGYNELQQDYSLKTEQIEYLEYRIMSDDSISPELKQEIENNVPEEDK